MVSSHSILATAPEHAPAWIWKRSVPVSETGPHWTATKIGNALFPGLALRISQFVTLRCSKAPITVCESALADVSRQENVSAPPRSSTGSPSVGSSWLGPFLPELMIAIKGKLLKQFCFVATFLRVGCRNHNRCLHGTSIERTICDGRSRGYVQPMTLGARQSLTTLITVSDKGVDKGVDKGFDKGVDSHTGKGLYPELLTGLDSHAG